MGILLKSTVEFKNEDKMFEAKIRGYEIEKPVEVKPITKDEWGLVFKQIKKEQLKFERDKKIIEANRMR